MGTHSTITFYQKSKDSVVPLVNIYQQYDGYLDGVGKDLCEWLQKKIITNGFNHDDKRDIANGVGCLSAQYIRDHKPRVGDLYIYPAGVHNEWCDYNYSVIVDDGFSGEKKAEDITTIEIGSWGSEPYFTGTISEILNFIEKECKYD